jgi:hypothetical protein
MAIDERNVSTEATVDDSDDVAIDDLRRRLDSPLFARDPGIASAPQVPGLRELTWEHVINPTSQHAIVSPASSSGLTPVPKMTPVSIEALLSQPEPEVRDVPDEPDVRDVTVAQVEDSTESPTIDDAMLQISDRPPVAREADPVVAGLAELIARHTPAEGVPVVEPPVEPPVELVLEPLVEELPPPPPPPLVTASQSIVAPVASQNPMSAVEAELNRLAFVPDHEDLGPIEVPDIVSSTDPPITPTSSTIALPASAPAAAPALSLSQAPLFTPRQAMAPQHHGRTYADLITETAPERPHRKKHTGRKILVVLVLLGLLGGGLFAAKYYLLDRRHWSAEMAPLAKMVEDSRGLTFDQSVSVVTVEPDEYATRIGDSLLGFTEATKGDTESEWRALGLLTGPLDRRAIGLSAMADSPAFYDAASGHIYVVNGVQDEFRRFALGRALTLALLDQHFGWSNRIATESPSVQRGTRALFDADAMATAQVFLAPKDRPKVIQQVFGIYSNFKIPKTPSPFATAVAGRLGLADWPYFDLLEQKDRDSLEKSALYTDGQVLDLRRLTSSKIEPAGPNARGMLYWYHVLAGRIDDDLAWRAALTWQGDTLTTVASGSSTCVAAIFEPSASGAATAISAFQAWAKAAPKPSLTQAKLVPGTAGSKQITIDACDPGASVATNDGKPRLSLGGAPLRAEQFHQTASKQMQLRASQVACSVYGTDKVTLADERGIVDLPTGWKAPAAHPAPNPLAAGCAAGSP